MLCRLRCLRGLRSLRPVGTRGAATATAGTASGGHPWFLEERWWSSIFLVEDMELRQANVGDLLLTKNEFVLLRGRGRICRRFEIKHEQFQVGSLPTVKHDRFESKREELILCITSPLARS